MGKIKGIIRNSFYTRNEREENLNCIYGLPQGSDMHMFDFEFNSKGELIGIKKIEHEGNQW